MNGPKERGFIAAASCDIVASNLNPTLPAASQPATAELRRESRLIRIAKALASGATVTDIAEAEGIGRTLASREANSPECRHPIAEFVGDEWEEMRAVFYRSMRAIEPPSNLSFSAGPQS